MESNNEKTVQDKNNSIIGITKDMTPFEWTENVTVLDLSGSNIVILDENVKLPPKLMELNLSHNHMINIPQAVLDLQHIRKLDLSFNCLCYFNDVPGFCDSIEYLNLSSNKLEGPPYWVWSESPKKLTYLDLSNNINITKSFEDGYSEQQSTLVTEVKLYNCRIRNCTKLLKTFPKVKVFELGVADLGYFPSNHIEHIPCKGLDQCCDVERLNLSNTNLFNIDANIDIYINLIEINLSHNNISSVPKEFCHLQCLEICVLSCNKILYLPEDMVKLKNLICLRLDSNELCMVPENMSELVNLRILDLYDNSLHEVSDDVMKIAELDLALNYIEEPENEQYLEKKEKLRMNIVVNRIDGRKVEEEHSESVYSSSTTDDEELFNYMNNIEQNVKNTPPSSPSSVEDWDSDDHWVPGIFRSQRVPRHSTWLDFVKRKMAEGNFCPMDIHPVSVSERVKYEKLCNTQVRVEVEGQFDDYEDDDS